MKLLWSSLLLTLAACRRKGARYWIFAVAFGIAGWWLSHRLDQVPSWLELKYDTYVLLQNMRGGPIRQPQTVLVGIGDDEYYGPELIARKPINRRYLAKLVKNIAQQKPRIIALDIDFRSPDPSGAAPDFKDYKEEDYELFEALCAATSLTRLVVSRAVSGDSSHGLTADSNIYDGNTVCPIPQERISTGYLALPRDLRRIPLRVKLDGQSFVDSLSLAVARVLAPRQYSTPQDMLDFEELPYGSFHPASRFIRIDASKVLLGTNSPSLEDKIVIVFGDWHVLAKGRGGPVIDTFRTPVGMAGGAYLHANLIETLLAAEYRAAPPPKSVIGLEILLVGWLAVAFAFPVSLVQKFLYLLGTAAFLVVAAWLFFQVFAMFFDILPILAAMYLHAIADQVEEWREAAHRVNLHV